MLSYLETKIPLINRKLSMPVGMDLERTVNQLLTGLAGLDDGAFLVVNLVLHDLPVHLLTDGLSLFALAPLAELHHAQEHE